MILLPIIKIIQNNDNFYNQHNLIAYLRKRQDNEITIELINSLCSIMTVVIMIYTAVAIDSKGVKSRDKRKISISDYKSIHYNSPWAMMIHP